MPSQLIKTQNIWHIYTCQNMMLTLFEDHQSPLVDHFTSKGTTVTRACYCNALINHLRPAIR
jgi:hypothetical protein